MLLMLLPVLTGLVLILSFPRCSAGYLAWVAYIPLIAFVLKAQTRTRAFLGGWLAGFISIFALLIWISEVLRHYGGLSTALAWVAFGLVAAMLALYPAAACALSKHLINRYGTAYLLLFPVLWILCEYAQSLTPFGGLPWLMAGYTQSNYLSLIQISDITGIYGVSFLILCVGTALVWLVTYKGNRKWTFVPAIVALVFIAASFLYGQLSLRKWGRVQANYRAAMLQGNISFDDAESILIRKFQQGYAQMADTLKPGGTDLLLLPESPSPVSFQEDSTYREALGRLAQRYPLGLVFNNIRSVDTARGSGYFNSAYFLDRNGAISGIYDKIHLVPFGEYLPSAKVFSFMETITKDVSAFSAGKEVRVLRLGEHRASAIICFEAVFPDLVRRFVQNGSQLLINLTNDGWYGDSAAPYQHLAIARVRAVENRRYLLRATNSGISAIIEPSGRIQSFTQLLREDICQGHFAFLSGQTLYARYGDVFVFLCAIILCALWGLARFRGAVIPKERVQED